MIVIIEIVLGRLSSHIPEIESVHDYTQFNISYGLEPKPNLNYPEYGFSVRTNEWGMYSPNIPLEKKLTRMAFLGDSYSVGPGIDYKDNFPYKVTENLKKHFDDIDYFVAGLGGSSAAPQALLFEKKYLKFKPDIVVYELYDDIRRDYYWNYGPYLSKIKVWNSVPPPLRKFNIMQQFMKIATTWNTKKNEEYYERTKEIMDEDPKKAWDLYTASALSRIYSITQENNIKFFLVCLPNGYQFNDEYKEGPAESKISPNCENANIWAKENSVPYLDAYPHLEKLNTEALNELYLDESRGYHLTATGTAVVSDQITSMIIKSMGLRK